MAIWISLLRGINVGGRNRVAMADLRQHLEGLGFTSVMTYIQSGNCVFESDIKNSQDISDAIATMILKVYGFQPRVMTLEKSEFDAAVAQNPFSDVPGATLKSVHLYFLSKAPAETTLVELETLKTETETFILNGRVFYLHAPDGIGLSKLASRAEEKMGVDATARNLRTVQRVAGYAEKILSKSSTL